MTTIPTSSLYPTSFDSDNNLYTVHDGLRVRLAEDYTPGDTFITVEVEDISDLTGFPPTGQITLTEQCSDVKKRAISFYYSNIDINTLRFEGLEILNGFEDVSKPKRITNVTQNVMADHHNNVKDAVIAIQKFLGVEGIVDKEPFGETLEGRINFLRNLVLQPKAWFKTNKRIGLVPLEVEFTDMSFRLGTDGSSGPVTVLYEFGDNTTSFISTTSIISATSMVPDDAIENIIYDEDQGVIKKTYHTPGTYDVKMTVKNDFGEDVFEVKELINARVPAPDEAIIKFTANAESQDATEGSPSNGPYETVPVIRSPINALINISIPSGENPATPGISYAGELLNDSGTPIDPISSYTWSLSDDLIHENNPNTTALYSVGGIYDIKLRTDTENSSYRITSYEDAIDIIENTNLWLWTFQNESTVRSYEYGLISETFKVNTVDTLTVMRNDSFLDNVPESTHQKREFKKNTGFSKRGTIRSGNKGQAMLYWASGRNESDPSSSENINIREFEGFGSTYLTRDPISRPWNWANLNSNSNSYFIFGDTTDAVLPNASPTNLTKDDYNLITLSNSSTVLTSDNFLSDSSELMQNVASYDLSGDNIFGHFSVYRTAWKDNTGYIARNDGVGDFFRIKSFYRTEGIVGSLFQNIRKLQDIQGVTKLEGELATLSNGIYFFNNSGSISAYSDTTESWTSGGPGFNSVTYRALQDTTVDSFDSPSNTLLVTSDEDKRAYITYDYSPNVFLKFNEVDTTFSTLGSRPTGEQWIMGIY